MVRHMVKQARRLLRREEAEQVRTAPAGSICWQSSWDLCTCPACPAAAAHSLPGGAGGGEAPALGTTCRQHPSATDVCTKRMPPHSLQARIERERQEEARLRREQQQKEKAERERADRERAEK